MQVDSPLFIRWNNNAIKYPHVWWKQEGSHDFKFWNMAMPAALDWLTGSSAG
jgi:S-formylglutathione hydrolase FrmB